MVGVLVFAVVVVSDQVREPWHSLANTAVAIALVGYAIRITLSQSRQQKELRVRQRAERSLLSARDQLARSRQDATNRAIKLSPLTELSQFLQSCASEAEAYPLVGNAIARFLPDCSGALYKVLPSGQDWKPSASGGLIRPRKKSSTRRSAAVRRGRAHKGNRDATPVNCAQLTLSEKETSLCVPILVQGETAGVLILLPNPDAPPVRGDRLDNTVAGIRRVGTAVAEQMASPSPICSCARPCTNNPFATR
jgi:hypothetical protein